MIAYWGGGRIVLRQRLGLLQKIGTEWNPRFGANNGIMINLVRLAEFYHASRCILVLERTDKMPRYIMHVSDRRRQKGRDGPMEIADTTARELLLLPNTLAVSYENPGKRSLRSIHRHTAYDFETQEPTERYLKECENLSNLFDGDSFISVPYKQPGVAAGRLYLIARYVEFGRSDIAFVKQAADVISSVVENMQLIEDLIAEAEGRERHRISLDVHDTTIQPYIGLTLALDALAREFKDNEALAAKIGEIVRMANMSIHDLRSYKDILREKSLMRGDVLLSAVRNQAERMLHFYGIQLDVRGAVEPNLPGRLAEAAYQIVKEGISNILRHTDAKRAYVSFVCADGSLKLEIGNEGDIFRARPLRRFTPKSIAERAASLNGHTQVEIDAKGNTVVSVSIPNPKEQEL
jgi:signal transduction histidine kinase